jgi:hypothetical protein
VSLTEQLRTCPSCAVGNPPGRELCRSCGVDLEDGHLLPRPSGREAPDPPSGRDAPPRRRHRWVWTLLGVLLLVAVLVGALTLAGLGPLARGPAVPGVDFAAERYPDEPGPLALASVATRTTSEDLDAEAAAAIADGDPTTAWRSAGTAAADRDILDTIDLLLDGPAWIDRIELRNGDHLDREAYDASARLREVRLRFDGGVVIRAELLDLGLRAQVIELPDPVLTTDVRIDVLRAVAGPNDQLAVSGIDLIGWPATGDDVTAAEERAAAEPASGPVAPAVPGGSAPAEPAPGP